MQQLTNDLKQIKLISFSLFSSLQATLSQKAKEARKILRYPETRDYALKALKEVEQLLKEISNKLELYNAGNFDYNISIIKDLDIIQNNFLEELNFPRIADISELKALQALFSPINNLCNHLRKELELPKQENELREDLFADDELGRLLVEEQNTLNSFFPFINFLKTLQLEIGARNPQPRGVYFAYAWPVDGKKNTEDWVQGFLKLLKQHFVLAGINTIRLDIVSSRYGENIYEYMQGAEKDEYVLLFGTESLKEKHDGGIAAVCTEIINIFHKRESDKKKGATKVIPILLSGTNRKAFPVEYERYVAIMNWKEKGYVQGFQELYLELFGLPPERYLSRIEEIWQQKAKEVQKVVDEYIGKRKQQFLTSRKKSLLSSSIIDFANSSPYRPLLQSMYKKNIFRKTKTIRIISIFLVVFFFFSIPLFFFKYDGKKVAGMGSGAVTTFLKNQTVEEKSILVRKKMQRISSLKGTHPDFIGRDNIISTLTQAFLHPDINYQNQCYIRMIHGEGGLGKTETAIAFANQYLEDFSLIWWIDVETEASYAIGYRELARALNMVVTEEESTSALVTRVNNYLQETPFEKPFLLIFDNFEDNFKKLDFHRLLPQRGGAIIITSKIRSIWPIIEMPPFSLQEAISLFQKINPREKPSLEMEELAKELSYTPLLINAAAHMIEERSSWKVSHYQEELVKKIEEQNGPLWQAKDQQKRFDKERTLAASWELTLEHFEKDFSLAFQWLLLCAYFRPTNIPVSWIPSWLELQGIKKDQLALESGNLEAALKRFKVLIYDQETETFSMHRFWQAIIKAKHKSHKQQILLQMVSLLGKLGQKIYKGVAVTREERKAWLLHLTSFEELSKEVACEKSEYLAAALNFIGQGLWILGRFVEAVQYHTQALDMRKSFFGERHLDIAASLDSIGQSLSDTGEYAKAENYHQMALEMYKALLGETSHLDYAKSLNNSGWNLYRFGRAKEGLEYAKQSLEMRKKILGVEHPDIAESLNTVGAGLDALGRYEEALVLDRTVLAMRKKFLGEEHPDVAMSLNNVGFSLRRLGKYEEALTYHRVALAMRQKLLGEEHPYVAWSLNSLGISLNYLGRYEEALTYHKTALSIQKKLLGEKHPDIAWSLNNVGVSLNGLGKYEEALTYHRAALAMRQKLLGEEHPHIAISLNNVGVSLNGLRRYEEALSSHGVALAMWKKLLGEEHPDIARSLSNMGSSLRALKKYQEALEYQKEAFEMACKTYQQMHPDIILYLESVIYELQQIQNKPLMEKVKNELYPLCVKMLGKNHAKVQDLLKVDSIVLEQKYSQWKLRFDLQKFFIEGMTLFMIVIVGIKLFPSAHKK